MCPPFVACHSDWTKFWSLTLLLGLGVPPDTSRGSNQHSQQNQRATHPVGQENHLTKAAQPALRVCSRCKMTMLGENVRVKEESYLDILSCVYIHMWGVP